MGLLEKLIDTLASTRGTASCPECGEGQPFDRTKTILSCPACHYRGSRTEWSMRRMTKLIKDGAATPTADPDSPPPGTKIVRRTLDANTLAWEVPPAGKSAGLLFFATLWLGFVTFWTFGTLFAVSSTDDPKAWLFPAFSIPFWAVGLWMLYYGLRTRFAKHLFLINAREVIMVRSLFGRKKRKTLHRDRLKWVQKKEFYQQNYTPVYGVEIRGEDGKLRFGTALSEDEKDWLVADMNRVLWPPDPTPDPTPDSDPDSLPELVKAAAHPRSSRSQLFEVTFPPAPSATSTVGLIFGFLIGGLFLAVGLFALRDPDFFRLLWLIVVSFFALPMIAVAVSSWRNRNRTIRVRGDRGEVQVAILRNGEVLEDKHMPRRGSITVHSYNTGQVNGVPRVRIELVGENQVLPIAKWYPQDLAAQPLADLKAALQ